MSDAATVRLWRLVTVVVVLAAWELHGRLVDISWISQPSLILRRLGDIFVGQLGYDIGVTLSEIALGFLIGLPSGLVVGLLLGRSPMMGTLFRPIIVTLNSVPYVALAPILIMWFGLGIAPKVALVALVVFFLIFFNTFSGAQSVDDDQIEMLELMGASRIERFQKIIAPASIAWIMSGLKAALPYSLIAATVGEMMLSRAGVGNYITNAASQFDLTGVYTGLFIMMALGAMFNEFAHRIESWLLRWRPAAT